MTKRKSVLFATILTLGALAVSTFALNHKNTDVVNAECSHIGFHYEATSPTSSSSGNLECWICCKCHETFVGVVPNGTWTTQSVSLMTGTFDDHNIAYIPMTGSINKDGDYYVVDPFED